MAIDSEKLIQEVRIHSVGTEQDRESLRILLIDRFREVLQEATDQKTYDAAVRNCKQLFNTLALEFHPDKMRENADRVRENADRVRVILAFYPSFTENIPKAYKTFFAEKSFGQFTHVLPWYEKWIISMRFETDYAESLQDSYKAAPLRWLVKSVSKTVGFVLGAGEAALWMTRTVFPLIYFGFFKFFNFVTFGALESKIKGALDSKSTQERIEVLGQVFRARDFLAMKQDWERKGKILTAKDVEERFPSTETGSQYCDRLWKSKSDDIKESLVQIQYMIEVAECFLSQVFGLLPIKLVIQSFWAALIGPNRSVLKRTGIFLAGVFTIPLCAVIHLVGQVARPVIILATYLLSVASFLKQELLALPIRIYDFIRAHCFPTQEEQKEQEVRKEYANLLALLGSGEPTLQPQAPNAGNPVDFPKVPPVEQNSQVYNLA